IRIACACFRRLCGKDLPGTPLKKRLKAVKNENGAPPPVGGPGSSKPAPCPIALHWVRFISLPALFGAKGGGCGEMQEMNRAKSPAACQFRRSATVPASDLLPCIALRCHALPWIAQTAGGVAT